MDNSQLLGLLSFLESFSSSFQNLTKAEISPISVSNLTYEMLTLFYGQTKLKENITQSQFRQFLMSNHNIFECFPLDSSAKADGFSFSSISPSKKRKAVLQASPNPIDTSKKRTTLEVYEHDLLLTSLNLDEFHEAVLNNAMVGTPLVWSKNENRLVYLAELKTQKNTGYFDSYTTLEEKQLKECEENYKYEPDFGEKLTNITKIGLFVYDINAHKLNQLKFPHGKLFPTNPNFIDFEGNGLILCGFLAEPVKLGILHCINRPAKIFLEKEPRYKQIFPKLTKDNKEEVDIPITDLHILIDTYDTCIRPCLSPNMRKLAYLGTPLQPPHLSVLALNVFDLDTSKDECVIPVTRQNIRLKMKAEEVNTERDTFTGICGYYDVLDKMQWIDDDRHLLIRSITGFDTDLFVADCQEKQIVKITPKNETRLNYWNVLCQDQMLIASFENMKSALFPKMAVLDNLTKLLSLNIPLKEMTKQLRWSFIEPKKEIPKLQNSLESLFSEKFKELTVKQGDAEGLFWTLEGYDCFSDQFYEYFPCEKRPEKPKEAYRKPLIVVCHGGPHGNSSGHPKLLIFYLLRGYSLLIPNFTGSCGYGQEFIDSLMKKIGDIDVEEIIGMIKQIIDQNLCDSEKIVIVGRSYGGYLSGIMATHPKHSSIFKAAVLMNPVVSIPFMLSTSDIPEWGVAVGLAKKEWSQVSPDEIKRLYQLSPMSKKCQIPCLLMLGSKDRRVPHQAGLAFRNKTLLEGGRMETFIYESDHALADNPKMEYDVAVRIVEFIERMIS